MGAHLRFLILDGRIPRDPGLYHRELPQLHAALVEGRTGELLSALGRPAGWYNDLLALFAWVHGRDALVLQLPMLLWVSLLLLATARAGRRLGGAATATAAVALVATMPMIVVLGRMPWIHVPEAALLMVVLATLAGDPVLARGRSLALVGLCGLLAITLRESGAPWLLALLLPWAWPGAPRPRPRRLLALGLPWLLALAVPARGLALYLHAKLGARERYAEVVPPIIDQLAAWIGPVTVILGVVGLVGLAWRRPRDPRLLGPLAWLVGGFVLWALFRSGIENFGVMAPALGLLAGLGLARLRPWLPAVAVAGFVPFFLQPLLPFSLLAPLLSLPGMPMVVQPPHPRNFSRPWDGVGPTELKALLAASCPSGGPRGCEIIIDQGLLEPFTEDPGGLEMFLLGIDGLSTLSLRDTARLDTLRSPAALIEFDCPDGDDAWRQRYPNGAQLLGEAMQQWRFAPVWEAEVWPRCTLMWMTPKGKVLAPEAMPRSGKRITDARPPPPPREDARPGRGPGPRGQNPPPAGSPVLPGPPPSGPPPSGPPPSGPPPSGPPPSGPPPGGR